MEKELQEEIREWLKPRVTDEELIDVLLSDDALKSTMNIYKKRTEEWKKKL